MNFERIVVFGDFHGDLDIMLASLADRGLIRYNGEIDDVIDKIKNSFHDSLPLETMVIAQKQPVRVVFLGDFLDRYDKAYHIIQLVEKIRWESFDIYPIFLIGNHDFLNFHFFVNPFELADIYQGCGHSKSNTVSYINSMGIDRSLESFMALHSEELINRQLRFYETGTLEYQEAGYTVRYQYPIDFSPLAQYRLTDGGYTAYYHKIIQALGLENLLKEEKTITELYGLRYLLSKQLGKLMLDKAQRNWWDISAKMDSDDWGGRYDSSISHANLLCKEVDEEKIEILPIDWRVISLVWRHHYGHYFRRTRLLHNEGNTLFVHAGISPLAMMDPLVFGNLYDPRHETFRKLKSKYKRDVSLEMLINRSNRLFAQIMENALNDYSFKRMNGAEVLDQIGYWRGGMVDGLPIFGGPVWIDFSYLQRSVGEDKKLQSLYRAFKEATGIERILCGHTHFRISEKPEVRFLKSEEFEEIGIEYLCVDNGCSKAYSRGNVVINGIEIDKAGQIVGEGEMSSASKYW
jgi:hypothetical protein